MPFPFPTVQGADAAATIEPHHVADLMEAKLWEGFGCSRQDIGVVGPALVAYFGCCGGTPEEAATSIRAHFRPKKSDRIVLPGHRTALPREVPLFELSKLKLSAYVSATDYAGEDDALFKNAVGGPMTADNIFGYFVSLGERIGVDGFALPGRLRSAFQRWTDDCATERVRTYLRGRRAIDRQRLAPLPKPAFSDLKAEFEEAHPLAKLNRKELQLPGPVGRLYPAPHFPPLSRGAWSDIAVAGRTRSSLPAEVLRGIQTAIGSGKTRIETAAHFGLAYNTVSRHRNVPTDVPPKIEHPSFRKIVLQQAARPGATSESVADHVNATYGSKLTGESVGRLARKHGVKLAPRPKKSLWRPHAEALGRRMMEGPPASLDDLVAWFAERGVTISRTGLEYALAKLGLDGHRLRTSNGSRARAAFESAWPTIRGWMVEEPGIPYHRLAARLEREMNIVIHFASLRIYIGKKADKPPHPPARGATRAPARRRKDIGTDGAGA